MSGVVSPMGMSINVVAKPAHVIIRERIDIIEPEKESETDNVDTQSIQHDSSI